MKERLYLAEMKMTAIFFLLAIFLCGCSSSYSVRSTAARGAYSFNEMNQELKGEDATIELNDRNKMRARKIKISDDSLSWVDASTGQETRASLGHLNRIVIKNHLLGGLEGLGIGLVCGTGGGAAVGGLFPNPRAEFIPTWLVTGVIGGLAGIIIGPTTGIIVGHSYIYQFSTTK